MNLHLKDFDKYVTPAILKRGKTYYRNDHILLLEEDESQSGYWYAEVQGSYDNYEVNVQLESDGQIQMCECSCPYDWEDICKHVVAVLLKIRDLNKKRQPEIKPVKKKVKVHSVQEMLELFKNLPLPEQRLLKILAVNWEPSSVENLINLYRDCRFETKKDKTSYTFIQSAVLILFSQDLLTKEKYNQYQLPHPYADAICDQYFSTDPDFKKIEMAFRRSFLFYSNWTYNNRAEVLFRNMRLGRYVDDLKLFKDHFLELPNTRRKEFSPDKLLEYWVGESFNKDKWESLGRDVRFFLLYQLFNIRLLQMTALSADYVNYVKETITDLRPALRFLLVSKMAQLFVLQGNWKEVEVFSSYFTEHDSLCFAGIKLVLEGKRESAEKAFREARKLMRKKQNNNKAEVTELEGVFSILSQMNAYDLASNNKIKKQLENLSKQGDLFGTVYYYLSAVLAFFENNKPFADQALIREAPFESHRFFLYLCRYWVEPSMINPIVVEAYRNRLTSDGYTWVAAEMNALLGALGYETSGHPLPEGQALIHFFPRIEEWETALAILLDIGGKSDTQNQTDIRLVWFVDFDHEYIQARQQTFGKNGWTKGRPISFDRFYRERIPGITPQDERFINNYGYGSGSEVHISSHDSSWKHLVGHPLLFLKKSPETAIQIVEVQPKLIAKRSDNGFQLSFHPEIPSEGAMIIKETPTRYLYMEVSPQAARIAEALNGQALSIPLKGEEQLQKALSGLAGLVELQSAFEDDKLPTVEADNRICIHLLPIGDGFHVEPYVKPFQSEPPYVKPGQGEAHIISTLDGQRTATTRDLAAEEKNLKILRTKIPVLKKRMSDNTWKLEDAETCLQLLLQLKPLVEDKSIIVEWPRGEKLHLDSIVGFDQFRMSISDGNNWFELEGTLRVDEEKVLNLQELLLFSEAESSFIEIGPGKFLALTEEFRKKLQAINGLPSHDKKSGKLILHPLAAPSLESFTEAVQDLDISPKFKENRKRLEEAFSKKFKIPKDFKASLRSYQTEGYQWLCRCAAWGVGACLADDMGLGKTIQALAFLSNRAQIGPALVVAPASVCRNWVAETIRFAPKLRPVLFGEGNRQEDIDSAKKGTLLIVTYDLMVRENKLFVEKEWGTVILDEAQAIKNQATRRSETAMELKADFKMVMTGTPIENHLGELWNLLNFINPGLLGNLDSFNQRFALPIEKYKDNNRREQLQRLLKPFILRRRKDEVLKDLPDKTEITLSVALSPDEQAFYEALRRNALEKLTANANQVQAGQQHLQILAEIMKLRRAACHPSLADKTANFKSSSKLELFGEIVSELLDNGHKALVFSQFVDHLKILEKYLKKNKITYQYLDGSTPGKKRQVAIDAFQAGEGDIFLISLKAGGTGLNLTAADYVIHTDPWWNPAVEDQATDRAHRIGQERPVTVYRLIAEQTIEEKILKLHAQKRDLADSLLAGTNASAKLTAKDLMELLE